MKFKPVGNKILIEAITPEATTKGGIYIPEAHQDASSDYVVVKIGTGDFEVKVGDRVIINRFDGIQITISGKPFKLVEDRDILAIIE
jgi:chaperonin GroES